MNSASILASYELSSGCSSSFRREKESTPAQNYPFPQKDDLLSIHDLVDFETNARALNNSCSNLLPYLNCDTTNSDSHHTHDNTCEANRKGNEPMATEGVLNIRWQQVVTRFESAFMQVFAKSKKVRLK